MSRHRNYVFTINNYTTKHISSLQDEEKSKYIVFGKEVGKKGTPHLQGYLEFKNPVSLEAVKSRFDCPSMHLEMRRGTALQASDYCKKDKDFHEHGTRSNQGKRTDIEYVYNLIRDSQSDYEIQEEAPHTYAKYYKAFDRMRANFEQAQDDMLLIDEYKDSEPLSWQIQCMNMITLQDNRQILWICDRVGGNGKSWLFRYMEATLGAFVVSGGKNADIAFMYRKQQYIIFDIPRSHEDFVNYGLIEKFKDGRITSTKYESKLKRVRDAKVVVFANFTPKRHMWSQDRLVLKYVESKDSLLVDPCMVPYDSDDEE